MANKVSANSQLLDDCFLHDKDRLRHAEALELIKDRLKPIAQSEKINLTDAPNRILAENIISKINIPNTDNSAVDGYAFAHSDYEAAGGFFAVIARIAAGETEPIQLPQNSAARIFTGATMPLGADTVAMQEDCEPHEQDGAKLVAIPPGLKTGANRRKAGEDVKQGTQIGSVGERLSPALIAAIASAGIGQVAVYKKLKIGLISSGNELIEPGNAIKQGQVYNSNKYLITSLLATLPAEIIDLGTLTDNYNATELALKNAAQKCDVVISSGGASKGEEDHIVTALSEIGKRHLWQLAVKPGRPMMFGQIGQTPFFGLPGNPVACFVCFLLYVRQAILQLSGQNWREPQRYFASVDFNIQSKKPDRREFWRAKTIYNTNGSLSLSKFERDGSGLITGLRTSDGLIEVAEEIREVKKGDLLPFIPYSQFF